MSDNLVKVIVKEKFDLGYIGSFDGDQSGQLRALEMKGDVLEHHVHGTEDLLYGVELELYPLSSRKNITIFSQFSEAERNEKEQIAQLRKTAFKNCILGKVYKMVVTTDYEWGYLCEERQGYLHGAIKKPAEKLDIGSKVTVKVVSKTQHVAPFFEIVRVDT